MPRSKHLKFLAYLLISSYLLGIKRSISNNDGPMEIMETMIKKAKNIENSNNGNSDANFITNSNADEPYDGDLEVLSFHHVHAFLTLFFG